MIPQYLPVPDAAAYVARVDLYPDEDAASEPVQPSRIKVAVVVAVAVTPTADNQFRVEALAASGELISSGRPRNRLVAFGPSVEQARRNLEVLVSVERITRWLGANPELAVEDGRPPLPDATERGLFDSVRSGWLAMSERAEASR